jgi:hypothetical protein
MPRLKVFSFSDGFHAFTVAASSRPKALAAWGMQRDVFKDGLAQEIASGPDYDAALKAPGEVIQRGLSVDVGRSSRRKTPAARKAKAPSKAAREKVARLQAELDALDQDQAAAIKALEVERKALDELIDKTRDSQRRERERMVRDLKAARTRL